MTTHPLIWPLLMQVGLTMLVTGRLYYVRLTFLQRERIHPQTLATRHGAEAPLDAVAAPSDNFKNQFETPVLFFVALLLAIQLGIHDMQLTVLAWAWILFRHLHAAIHLSYNKVVHRFYAFFASSVVLFAMWAKLTYDIIIG